MVSFPYSSRALLLQTASLLLSLPLVTACGSSSAEEKDGAASQAAMTVAAALPSASTRAEASPAESSAGAAPASPVPPSPPAAMQANAAAPVAAAAPAPPAQVFAACTYSEGLYGRNCDNLFVTMKEMSPERCVQLTIDNCGDSDRGLGGRAPEPWSLDSATVGSDLDECELGVFYPDSTSAQRATGTLSWNETTRLPSEIVLDLALELSNLTGSTSIEVTTAAPIVPSECER